MVSGGVAPWVGSKARPAKPVDSATDITVRFSRRSRPNTTLRGAAGRMRRNWFVQERFIQENGADHVGLLMMRTSSRCERSDGPGRRQRVARARTTGRSLGGTAAGFREGGPNALDYNGCMSIAQKGSDRKRFSDFSRCFVLNSWSGSSAGDGEFTPRPRPPPCAPTRTPCDTAPGRRAPAGRSAGPAPCPAARPRPPPGSPRRTPRSGRRRLQAPAAPSCRPRVSTVSGVAPIEDQRRLFQIDFVAVDERPALHGHGPARARHRRAAGAVEVLRRQVVDRAVRARPGRSRTPAPARRRSGR